MEAKKHSTWLALLGLGLAIYGLAPVVDSWHKRDWERAEPQEVSGVTTSRTLPSRNALGQPGHGIRAEGAMIGYRYAVGDSRYWGTWKGGGDLVQPLVVLYDPARPQRSTLLTKPPSTARAALGWIGLGLAGFFAAARLVRL